MPEIQLTRGRVTIVDTEDLSALSEFSWTFHPATIGDGYAMANIDGKTIYMHRFLIGAVRGQEVDHANRNSLDNRRSNLRLATRSQQTVNAICKLGMSGFRGVQCDFHSRSKPFRGKITLGGKQLRGPYRRTAEEAAADYDDLARTNFGEFAVLNFPERLSQGQ